MSAFKQVNRNKNGRHERSPLNQLGLLAFGLRCTEAPLTLLQKEGEVGCRDTVETAHVTLGSACREQATAFIDTHIEDQLLQGKRVRR
jgi:hypothetical protein